jgi:Flp pilus assembly protein TadD
MALAATGKTSAAEAEYKILDGVRDATPADAIFAMPFNNKTQDILTIATDVLGAKIAFAKKDNANAIERLRHAVEIQDKLNYGEPPDWFSPVRESLGAALIINGDAAGAEKVFRADLDRNPRNPRSLFGLQQALKSQGRNYDAGFVQKQFNAAWKGGSAPLKVENLV